MKFVYSTLLFLLTFSTTGLKAQQDHFVYIQTENNQPFYIKINNIVYSSSGSGYLIVPKLQDGALEAIIGFPKGESPEQKFALNIDKKDLGYLLKDFGDKGWGLFNLQTLDVTMAGAQPNTNVVKETKTDAFSTMLASAVNDPSIKQKEAEEEIKPAVQKSTDTIVNTTPSAIVEADKPKPEIAISKPTITKISSNITPDGNEIVYVDVTNDQSDTIKIFIPAEKIVVDSQQNNQPEQVKAEPAKEEKPKDKKFINMDLSDSANTTDTSNKSTAEKIDTESKPIISAAIVKPIETKPSDEDIQATITNNCKNTASSEDFLKLRKKMAGENSEDNMMAIAKKIFKTKCFTTWQVGNLSVLFLTDAGKYEFFDMAYKFVSNPQNYSTLESQLTDPYYIDRFKVMIRH